MKRKSLKTSVLSQVYLVSIVISLALLWCTSLSIRVATRRHARMTITRRVLLLRVLARHAARALGATVLVFMGVPALLAGVLALSAGASLLGAVVGFMAFALLPVMLSMPSREMADAAATGLRFI